MKAKDRGTEIKDLRRDAEAEIKAEAIEPEAMSPEERIRLIHELRVHQIELEMQNEELRRAQAELDESRGKYADLYDFAPVGYLTLSDKGQITEANLTAASLLGVERSRLVGSFLARFLANEDRGVFLRHLANILHQQQQPVHLRDENGAERVLLLDLHFYPKAENHERWRAALTDITELSRAQEELRLHKEDLEKLVTERTSELSAANERLRQVNDKLEALFQAAPLAIGVFDKQGRVVSANPAAERMFDWPLAETLGRVAPTIPEDGKESWELLQQVLRGKSLVGMEVTQQRRDGSRFDISVSTAPLRDNKGDIQGFVALAEDISERKKVAAALQTQVRVLGSMVEGVAVTAQNGQIMYTNAAFDRMFGYEPGELKERHCTALNAYPAAENEAIVKDIIHEISRTGAWHGEFHNRRKDGSTFYSAAHISSLQVNGNRFYVSVQEDITQRKEAEREIRRLASFPELNPIIILETNEDGKIIYANPAARQAGEKIGLPEGLHAFLPADLPEIFAAVREGGSRLYNFDKEIEGTVYSTTLHLPEDFPTARLYSIDITERRRGEKALAESEERYRSLFQNNHAVMLLIDPETAAVVDANPAAVTYYGYAQDELTAMKMTGINTLPIKQIRAEMRQACSGQKQQFYFKHRLAGGEVREVETFSGPIKVKGKKLLYSIVHDITERRRLEAEVAMKAQLLEMSSDSILVADLEGNFHYINEAAYKGLGYSREELLNCNVADLLTPGEAELVPARLKMLLEKGELNFESSHRRKDGSVMPVEAYVKQISIDGRTYALTSVRDITARIEAEEALRLSNQRLELLATTAGQLLVSASPQGLINDLCKKISSFLDTEVFLNFLAENGVGQLRLNAYDGITAGQADKIGWINYGAGVCGSAAKGGRRIEAEDIQNSLNPRTNLLKSFGLQAYACHPLLVEGKVLGTVGFGSRKRARFTEDELTLMQAVVDQVAITLERQRAEEALAESEERYRSLFQNNHAVMLLIDPETADVVDANPAACGYYGYSREELLAMKMTDINTLPTEQVRSEMRQACSGEKQQFFFQHRLAGGEIREVEIFTGAIQVKGKKLLYSIVHDITERRQAENELHLSYQRLNLLAGIASELLASAAPEQLLDEISQKLIDFLHCDVYLNFMADEEAGRLHLNAYGGIGAKEAGRIEWLNYGEGLCGYTAQERRRVVAEDIQESLDPLVEMLKKFGLQAYACHPLLVAGRVLGTLGFGTRHRARFDQDELRLMNAVSDQVALALERQRTEQALAQSERRYRRLVEMSPDAIVVHQQGKYMYVNPAGAKLFGAADPQEIIGRRVLELVHPDFVDVVKGRVEEVYEGKTATLLEVKILRLDGRPVDVEATAVPVEFKGERAVQAMLRDITWRKEAAEALKQERDFSAALLDTLGALVIVLDREGRVVRFNQACETITGYSFAEVEGKFFYDIFLLPEEKDGVRKVFRKLRRGDVPSSYENYWLSRSGEKILLSWSNTVLRDADGAVTYVIGTGIDITRQRRAEEALRLAHNALEERVAARTEQLRNTVDKLLREIIERERAENNLQKSEARFAAFMRNLPGSAVMRDRAGRFLFANEAWELELGRRPGESLGKTVDELWPPEIAAKLNELDRQVLVENRAVQAVVELPVRHEKRTYLSYRFPIRTGPGEVEMIGAIGIDITDRLKAEEARDRLIEIMEATPDFIGSADWEGRLFYLNRAAREMLGLGAEEDYTSLHFDDAMPAWAVDKILTIGKPVYMREGFWQGESAIRRRNGREIPVSQVILAHQDQEGKVKFFSTICRDISEMKQAEEKLRKSEEKLRLLTMQLLNAQEDERKRLAAELHDELGHALLTLKLHLSGVEQKLLPDQADLKEKMAQIVEYLTDTVEEVRRLYYALSPGDLEDLGLTTALRNMVEDFQEFYPNIEWHMETADVDGLFPLPIQTIIYRIVQEALTNIGKHAYPKNVKIKIEKKDREAAFVIEDDGRGFSMDDVLESDERGMGLGAMAQRVSLAGGIFDVWSRENQGVRLVFNIPFSPPGENI